MTPPPSSASRRPSRCWPISSRSTPDRQQVVSVAPQRRPCGRRRINPKKSPPMKCPFCKHEDTQVLDTRVSEEGDAIRRRRRCAKCEKRFTTYERIELEMPVVVKKNGSRSEFEPAKLRASLMLALRKRPVSADAVDAAIRRIEEK